MPDPIVEPENTRAGNKALAQRVEELEKTVKALLSGFKEVEKYNGENFMPEGTYHGTKFE